MQSAVKSELPFGAYIETLRKQRCRSLRETAHAIGISPQYYSEVEKGRRSTLVTERMISLELFLNLSDDESRIMYNKAAEARKHKDVIVPQDFSNYIVERDYAMAALRVAKKLNADENDWQRFVDDLIKRKGGK